MLVLSRRVGEAIYLNAAKVIVTKVGRERVALGIEAPQNVRITRRPQECDADELKTIEESIVEAMAVCDPEVESRGLSLALSIVREKIRERP